MKKTEQKPHQLLGVTTELVVITKSIKYIRVSVQIKSSARPWHKQSESRKSTVGYHTFKSMMTPILASKPEAVP